MSVCATLNIRTLKGRFRLNSAGGCDCVMNLHTTLELVSHTSLTFSLWAVWDKSIRLWSSKLR